VAKARDEMFQLDQERRLPGLLERLAPPPKLQLLPLPGSPRTTTSRSFSNSSQPSVESANDRAGSSMMRHFSIRPSRAVR